MCQRIHQEPGCTGRLFVDNLKLTSFESASLALGKVRIPSLAHMLQKRYTELLMMWCDVIDGLYSPINYAERDQGGF